MKRNNKKGFTIVELVIVIAVIAILAAVLIPTFSSIIDKANRSADQQAVHQMNTAIAAYDLDEIDSIADLKFKFLEDNIDANNYKPLTKGTEFYWTGTKIVFVEGNKVIYPEDAKGDADKDAWQSLSGEGNKEVADLISKTGTVTGEQNMQGASINIKPADNFVLGAATSAEAATIKNVVSDEGSKANATGDFVDNNYYAGLISVVEEGKEVTVQNLTIENAVVGDTTKPIANSARAGIIAGQVNGTLIIENVTIKNSTVFAGYRVGALVGAVGAKGKVVIKNVQFENVTVKASTIAAKLIGEVKATSVIEIGTVMHADEITMVNVNDDPTATIENELISYKSELYSNVTCAHLTQKYFWVQTKIILTNGVNYSGGYTSVDVAYNTSYNVA